MLADPTAINLEAFVSHDQSITIVVRAHQTQSSCPLCGQCSVNLHSNYVRNVADLPWHGVAVSLELHTRKFRCRNELCPRKVFCERLPQVVAVSGRKTCRLNAALTLLGFALGGEMAMRTSEKLGLKTSADTFLRRIRGHQFSEKPFVKVLGVDDFSFRKGIRWGTILVDLEKRKPIDLLADREAETLKIWLKEHPEVEIISRDRAGAYADGARRGAPQAVQIADRFHLLQNAAGVFEKTLRRNYKALRKVLQPEDTIILEVPLQKEDDENTQPKPLPETSSVNLSSPFHQEKQALFEAIKKMQAQGLNVNQIRLQIKRHHTTVSRYFYADEYIVTTRRNVCEKRKLITPFLEYLRKRWAEGCRNAKQLYREIHQQGFRGSPLTVRRATQKWREPTRVLVKEPLPKLPSLKRLLWLFLKEKEKLKDEEREMREKLLENNGEVRRGLKLVEEFREMVRNRQRERFEDWLERARNSKFAEFENFVKGLERDLAAVKAALEQEWSNGQTEGQISRLKFIKRQMYGRAKPDLLRARVLCRF